MKRMLLRVMSLMLTAVMLFGLGNSFPALAMEDGDTLGTSVACEGHTLGTFSGVPACVNENGDLHLCEKNFLDENFRNYIFTLSGATDGYFTLQECEKIRSISVSRKEIINLNGVEYFTKLSDLYADYNKLTELDISNNTELTKLNVIGNELAELNIGRNYKLKELSISSPYLTELDVSNNTALKSLYCSSAQLTEIDVSNNIALTSLNVHGNQLLELDVSNNTALTSLNVYGNQLSELDVSNNTALVALYCYSNQLTGLDVSNNTALGTLYCYSNQLTELDVSNNTALKSLYCESNQLTELDVSNNTALKTLDCQSNQLTELDVSNTAISYLNCDNNQLTKLAGVNNTVLKTLYCCRNKLTKLDVGNNAALDALYCYNNQLTELDVSNDTVLKVLECNNNKLTKLDVSNNTAIARLYCYSNQLTELDVSNNTVLDALSCYNNQLTVLDVSNNTALTYLRCESNKLDRLDISNNTALKTLDCQSNQLTELDVSNNTAITTLLCYDQKVSLCLYEKDANWIADLNSIIQKDNFSKIKSLSNGTFDSETGIVFFESKPSSITYLYDVGKANNAMSVASVMSVTVNLTDHIHAFSDWQTSTPATCTEPGLEYRICDCGEEETREVEALGHSYAEDWTVDTEPTCTVAGSKSHHCKVCDGKTDITEIPATGHSFGEWIQTDAPSCTDDGIERRDCTACDHYETKVISASGHTASPVVIENAVEVTCTENGSYDEVVYCSVCGAEISREGKTTEAVGHKYGEWSVIVEPTCTATGIEIRCCENCDAFEKHTVEMTAHDYLAEWTVDAEPTCTEAGSKSHHCKVCDGKTDITEIPANGHTFGEWILTDDPTCTDEGTERCNCTACDHYETRAVSATGHTASGVFFENALKTTCTAGGSYDEVIYCTVCGTEMSREHKTTEAIGHKWMVSEVVEATPTERGYTVYVCENDAEHTYIGDYTDYPVVYGDLDGNGYLDTKDVTYLINHIEDPEKYPISDELYNGGDFNMDGTVDRDDAVYLLYSILMPDRYPLKPSEK